MNQLYVRIVPSSNIWRPANAPKCMTRARGMEPRGAGVMASIASEGSDGEIINRSTEMNIRLPGQQVT